MDQNDGEESVRCEKYEKAFAGPRPLTVLGSAEDLTVPDDVDQDRGFVEELDEDSLPDSIDDMYIQSGIVELCGSLVEVRPLQVLDISNASRS